MTRAEFVQRGWLSLANEVEVVGRTIIGRMELAVTHATSLAKIVAMADVLEASGNAPWSDEVDYGSALVKRMKVRDAEAMERDAYAAGKAEAKTEIERLTARIAELERQ